MSHKISETILIAFDTFLLRCFYNNMKRVPNVGELIKSPFRGNETPAKWKHHWRSP